MMLDQKEVDRIINDKLEEAYDTLENRRDADQAPSEIGDFLRNWDLEDHWFEWWDQDDGEVWS